MSDHKNLTHVDRQGRASMVDVGGKPTVRRSARAEGWVKASPETLKLVQSSALPKGNPFEVARMAGILAAKRTSDLIPLCHSLHLDYVNVDIELYPEGFRIESQVSCRRATGVEMEALTAVAVAALTIYDMCKAVDSRLGIDLIRLIEKAKAPARD